MRTFNIGGNGGHEDFGFKAAQTAVDFMSHDQTMSFLHWFGFHYNYAGRVQSHSRTRMMWNTFHKYIAEANSIINAIEPDTENADAKAILGQALALKSCFTYFLARVYAHTYSGHESDLCLPLVDGKDFNGKPRSTVQETYAQIRADLASAVTLLEGFSRPNLQALDLSVAQGILAQVALEMGDWQVAASMANTARMGYGVMTGEEYVANGFSNINGGNPEFMWGSDIDAESSTVYASFFSHMANTSPGYAGLLGVYKSIDADLYSKIPDTDLRKQAYVDPVEGHPDFPDFPGYANLKFQDASFFEGDYIYMRSAEMYLIEAEALARSGNSGGAASVLFELVSTRDPGYAMSSNSGDALIEEIYLQRRIELWGEGTAWFDLKRLKKPLVRDYPGTNHAAFGLTNEPAEGNRFRFQLPLDEINANPNISDADQNPN
jgi:hypothetical protein